MQKSLFTIEAVFVFFYIPKGKKIKKTGRFDAIIFIPTQNPSRSKADYPPLKQQRSGKGRENLNNTKSTKSTKSTKKTKCEKGKKYLPFQPTLEIEIFSALHFSPFLQLVFSPVLRSCPDCTPPSRLTFYAFSPLTASKKENGKNVEM